MKYEYLSNTPCEQALSIYIEALKKAGLSYKTETVKTKNSFGRITAKAVYAKRCSPHFCASAMDGIALLASKTYGASETSPIKLSKDDYITVDTGDPLPENCDSVVMIENVTKFENDEVLLHEAVSPWQNVRQIGEDISLGDMIAPSFTEITPSIIGAFLAGGVMEVSVVTKPKAVIIPTGDEIVPVEQVVKEGDIPEYNSAVFSAMLNSWGFETSVSPIIPDKKDLLKEALKSAAQNADMVIMIAGSSAGRDDYTSTVIKSLGEVTVHGLAIKPGKPAVLGSVGKVAVIGVPGYPVSGIIVMEEIVKKVGSLLTKKDYKKDDETLVSVSKRMTSSLKYKEYVRCTATKVGEKTVAVPMSRGAGIVSGFAKASGIVIIPQNSEGLNSGEETKLRLIAPRSHIENGVCVIGSHDPLIDEISDILAGKDDPIYINSSNMGSMGCIMALKSREAHLGGIHLLDGKTGRYNVDYIKRYFPKGSVCLVRGVIRKQGIMVQKGNPKNIRGVKDLVGVAYVNRQKGAGTRILLDWLLEKNNISTDEIYGYQREEYTHTAVAGAIASGSADAGMGIYSASKIYDLDFIEVWNEQYDFLVDKEMMKSEKVKAFFATLQSDEFKERLSLLGGYELKDTGLIIEEGEIWN